MLYARCCVVDLFFCFHRRLEILFHPSSFPAGHVEFGLNRLQVVRRLFEPLTVLLT